MYRFTKRHQDVPFIKTNVILLVNKIFDIQKKSSFFKHFLNNFTQGSQQAEHKSFVIFFDFIEILNIRVSSFSSDIFLSKR